MKQIPSVLRHNIRAIAVASIGLLLAGCNISAKQAPPPEKLGASDIEPRVVLVPLIPGAQKPVEDKSSEGRRMMNDPAAIAAGKQLFNAMNCSGCHFNGGGGIGPALMDNVWIYGDSIENIAATIREGRPNGMPSFRGFLPEEQIWQVAAYVRSLSHPEAGNQVSQSGK